MARCVGIKRDVRLSRMDSYSSYNSILFKSYLTLNGDSYDRFLLRMFEMGESLNISNQCLLLLSNNNSESKKKTSTFFNFFSLVTNSKKIKNTNNAYIYMEDLIEHFCN